jgi:UDP-N-acetylmuramate--alanine ligase
MPENELHGMGRVRNIHFVGIGGAGMSGIAEVLHNLGYEVSGSDINENKATIKLKNLGVNISQGHDKASVQGSDVIVTSSAINANNPEVIAAKEHRIPVVPRAEMLAELMRFRKGIAIAGTHGKTTTTSLVASILAEGGLDPTYVIGGLLNSSGSNAKLGSGRYLVAEADESDASFLHLQPIIAILTNIDADHLDYYGGDYNFLKSNFVEFINRLPFYGLAVVCLDNKDVAEILPSIGKPFVTYGLDSKADFTARITRQEASNTYFTVSRPGHEDWLDIHLNLPGAHNVLNSLAAIIVANELGISEEDIVNALSKFEGIARRCDILGELDINNKRALLINDYAHHPSEIKATMLAIKQGWPDRRVVVIFQPHRYSRTRDLFDEFCKVLSESQALLLMDIYPAGEVEIPGINGHSLCNGIRIKGKVEPVFIENNDDLNSALTDVLLNDDVLLIMGAGDIGSLGQKLLDQYSKCIH